MPGSLHTVAFGSSATALLAQLIVGAKAADPLAAVTVVVPSATAGTTLRRAVAGQLGGLVGVSFRSLPQVAATLAGPDRSVGAAGIIGRAHIRAALRGGTSLTPDPAVSSSAATERALEITFAELAPLDEATLDVVAAAEPLAGAVVEVYRRFREAAGLPPGGHDVAGRAAARVLAGGAPAAGLGSVVLHLPRRVRATEVALLRALVDAGTSVAAVIGRTGDPDADVVADELAAALAPVLGEAAWSGGPPARPAWPTHLVRAPDPAEEVAMAVREVVAALSAPDPVAPERVAVLYRLRDPYLGLLHAALADAEVPHHAAAVTTLAQTVPGRVLTTLLDIGAGGFRHADVTALWRSGPMLDPVTGQPIRASRWDRLAREAGIGGGLDQWRSRLQRAIDTREQHLADYRPTSHVDPADPSAPGGVDFRVEQWQAIGAHVEHLAEALRPPPDGTWASWSTWLRGLLVSLVRSTARQRQPQAFEQVEAILARLQGLDGAEQSPTPELLRRVLEPELERPEPSHGRFGHGVVVGRLVDGVGADFDVVVVVGAADGQFPPHRSEDPLLADRVRDLTGGALGRRGLRREDERRDLLAALASAPRRVLTAPRADPHAQRERQPAAWFVAACSHHAGRMVGSGELPALRGEPWFTDVPSFEAHPAAMASPATARELDLGDLLADHDDESVVDGVVATAHAGLARGLTAATVRRAGRFDEWSGNVGPDESLVVDADRPRSPTGLERYAECPLRSFLSSVLHVGAIDDPTDAELISPIDEGSLVHEILERFIGEHAGKAPGEPWSDDDRAALDAIAEELTDRYESEGRTGRPLLWGVRRQQLRHQLHRILDDDDVMRAVAEVVPTRVELAFGDLVRGSDDGALDGSPPVSVVLANGRTVSFRGIIDRVDRSIDGRRLVVYDYKTGSSSTFAKVKSAIKNDGDLTARGTKLQLPIYALAAKAAYPEAEEVSSYYWFVGRKGFGEKVGALVDEQVEARFREVIDVIVEGIEEGRFPANPGDESWQFGQWSFDHCGWCEFDRICPTSRGEQWVELRKAPELARYRDLADPDEPEVDDGGGWMTDVLPLDQPARDTVVNEVHRNLFVEAGAGTGKTTTLVSRIVKLVSSGRLEEVRQLAAITFTEAAAAELRDRIRTALELAADPAAPSDLTAEERARCAKAATRIDEAVITTLHGFAQRILAEHPVAAHLPPAFEVDEGIPAELEFVSRWQSFVDDLVADPALTEVLRIGATLDLLLPRLSEVARVLKDRWDRLVVDDGAPPPVDDPLTFDVAPIIDALDAVVERYLPYADGDDNLVRCITYDIVPLRDALADAAATDDPLEVLRVLDSALVPKAGNKGTQGFWGKDLKADLIERIAGAREMQLELLDGLRRRVIARLAPELVRFTVDWADERRRAGRLHFHDLLVLARNLLWRDAEVRRALAQRWSVLVIDEFQDTDPLQVELVFALAAADPDRLPARWEDIELGAGRVLVVGDPKQSIYGFRGADITLWNRTRAMFDGGVVSLSENFRSVDAILDWVNAIFQRLIGEGDGDVQPSYADLSSHRTSLDAGHQVLFLGDVSTDRAAEVRVREATEIALAIATLRASGHEVIDDRTQACRKMRHDDIAILVPTRSPIGALERALDDLDIPYRIESRSLVWRTDAVRDVLNILTAVEDPADDVAVVAALRSPAFACTDRELLEWRKAGGRWDHTRRAPEEIGEHHAVRVAMDRLARWHHGRHWRSVDMVVDEVIRERRLVELTMAQRRPRDHWRRLRFVADQARAFVEAGGASLAQFLAWTRLQVDEGATAVETVVPEPDDDAVRILTVHGAKGLEFPVVVLAGLANGRAPTMTDVAWTAAGPELMVTAYGGGGRRFATAGWAAAKDDRAAFEKAESTRLLYVAATRARDTLIVSLHHPARADSNSLIRQLYPEVKETQERWAPSVPPAAVPLFVEPRPLARTPAEREAWLVAHETALERARRGLSISPTGLPKPPPVGQASLFEDEAASQDDEWLDDDAAERAPTPLVGDETDGPLLARGGTALGRAVHAVLEHAPLDGGSIDDLVAEAAGAEGADPDLVWELAGSALRSATLREARGSGRLWREVPIAVPFGDRVLEGFIDLLYERADGDLVVVDWKTDKGRSPAEVDASMASYRRQGAAYAAALATATGRKVAEVRFVFCRDGGEPAVERSITDLDSAVAEVEALLTA